MTIFSGFTGGDYAYQMAMAPTIVVYLFAQRWAISGVTQGAVKH